MWSSFSVLYVQTYKEKRGTEDEMVDSIIDSVDMSLSKFPETVKVREAWCAAVHGVTKNWTQLSDWTIKYNSSSWIVQTLQCYWLQRWTKNELRESLSFTESLLHPQNIKHSVKPYAANIACAEYTDTSWLTCMKNQAGEQDHKSCGLGHRKDTERTTSAPTVL